MCLLSPRLGAPLRQATPTYTYIYIYIYICIYIYKYETYTGCLPAL